jgi:hypothetical protein
MDGTGEAIDAAHADPTSAPTVQHSATKGYNPAAVEGQAAKAADTATQMIQQLATGTGGGKVAGKAQETVTNDIQGKLDRDIERARTSGQKSDKEGDEQSRKEMAIQMYAEPAMKVISGLVDKWERIAKWVNDPGVGVEYTGRR